MHLKRYLNKRFSACCCLFPDSRAQKEIDDLRKSLSTDSVEQALRGVKEYAARSSDVNVDTI